MIHSEAGLRLGYSVRRVVRLRSIEWSLRELRPWVFEEVGYYEDDEWVVHAEGR